MKDMDKNSSNVIGNRSRVQRFRGSRLKSCAKIQFLMRIMSKKRTGKPFQTRELPTKPTPTGKSGMVKEKFGGSFMRFTPTLNVEPGTCEPLL
jgi:hypothetical protein